MTVKVKLIIAVAFDADGEGVAKTAILRARSEFPRILEEGKAVGAPTGVANAKVEILKEDIG